MPMTAPGGRADAVVVAVLVGSCAMTETGIATIGNASAADMSEAKEDWRDLGEVLLLLMVFNIESERY